MLRRGAWSLAAAGAFGPGIHLVSGDVGSGKSTLAAFLAGLIRAGSGSIHHRGIASSMVSFQFPEYHITGATVAGECRSWGLDPEPVLRSVNLVPMAGTDPLRLSRGELKRLHLACILGNDYDLLILDEPFSSLDCREKERVCRAISSRCRGITIIFTHEQSVFPRIDRIWEIRDRRLHDCGPLPAALACWTGIPPLVSSLVRDGRIPKNLAMEDLLEAACRT